MPPHVPGDEVTTGELARRLDAFSNDVRSQFGELRSDLRNGHVPRGEVMLLFDASRAHVEDVEHKLGAEIAGNRASIAAVEAQIKSHIKETADARARTRSGLWFPLLVGAALAFLTAGLTAAVTILATH